MLLPTFPLSLPLSLSTLLGMLLMLEDLRMELSEGKKLLYMDLTHEGP
jgi:hypothetical protein